MLTPDAAWGPRVPPGHTSSSWRTKKTVRRYNANAIPSSSSSAREGKHNSSSSIKLPEPGKRNILITAALPYVNNVPHLGNIIGCVLSGDVYSRFCRNRGHNSIYIGGTDEYGTATETKAREAGMSEQEICDKFHVIHRDIYQWFGIDFDNFGRTTNEFQKEIAQEIFWDCDKNNYISEKDVEQLYCESCERFLADRYIKGTCYYEDCGYEDARGDQCDQCGRLLDANDLKDARCSICDKKPVLRTSRHLFLDLKKGSDRLSEFTEEAENRREWTNNAIQITRSWIKEGLHERCISRDLKWGTPVPKEGFQDKVFYVWFDAPIGYVSITAQYTPEWRQWWHAGANKETDAQVELAQFIGKDNVPFHCVVFPITLMATGKPWTLLKKMSSTEYLNYENLKFSKSRGTGVFGDKCAETIITPEVWRYYLLSVRPEISDSVFLWNDLQSKSNLELLNNLGNGVNRTIKFIGSRFEGKVPAPNAFSDVDEKFIAEVTAEVGVYIDELENVRIKAGLKKMMHISSLGNNYLQNNAPWVLFKEDNERCCTVLFVMANFCRLLAVLVDPYMPQTTQKIFQQMNLPYPSTCHGALATEPGAAYVWSLDCPVAGHQMGTAEHLFVKISDDVIADYKLRFSGQDDTERTRSKCPLEMVAGRVHAVVVHEKLSESHFVLTVQCVSDADAAALKEAEAKSIAEQQPPTPSPMEPSTPTPVNSDLLEGAKEIAEQGQEVRRLKSNKDSPPEEVKAAIEKLKSLKAQYPAAAEAANPKKSKAKKKENRGRSNNSDKKKSAKTLKATREIIMERAAYDLEDMKGKIVIVVTNTKSTRFKGKNNEGVLLMAHNKESGDKKLITGDFPPGTKFLPYGYDFEAPKSLDATSEIKKLALRCENNQGHITDASNNVLCADGTDKTCAVLIDVADASQAKGFVVEPFSIHIPAKKK